MELWSISRKSKSSINLEKIWSTELFLITHRITKSIGLLIRYTTKSINFVPSIHFKRFTSTYLTLLMNNSLNHLTEISKYGPQELRFYPFE